MEEDEKDKAKRWLDEQNIMIIFMIPQWEFPFFYLESNSCYEPTLYSIISCKSDLNMIQYTRGLYRRVIFHGSISKVVLHQE